MLAIAVKRTWCSVGCCCEQFGVYFANMYICVHICRVSNDNACYTFDDILYIYRL